MIFRKRKKNLAAEFRIFQAYLKTTPQQKITLRQALRKKKQQKRKISNIILLLLFVILFLMFWLL